MHTLHIGTQACRYSGLVNNIHKVVDWSCCDSVWGLHSFNRSYTIMSYTWWLTVRLTFTILLVGCFQTTCHSTFSRFLNLCLWSVICFNRPKSNANIIFFIIQTTNTRASFKLFCVRFRNFLEICFTIFPRHGWWSLTKKI